MKEWQDAKVEDILGDIKVLMQFSFTCRGVFSPLCAFYGGFVAQECIKAITNKFTPANQAFYSNCNEVLPAFELK